VLILYTDGILDALNARGEEFGDARLRRVCAQHRAETAAQIVAALRDEVLAFVGDQPLADDCTVVIVKRV
jgi:sigma-B regulation protein RsbU (phosphoserine phosphatase)